MENSIINKHISSFVDKMKEDICNKINTLKFPESCHDQTVDLVSYIGEYPVLELTPQQIAEKPPIPPHQRCRALRSNKTQCNRAKKIGDELYCGCHQKNAPYGTVPPPPVDAPPEIRRVEISVQSICGISYFVDKSGHVYKTEDVLGERPQPRIIAHYHIDEKGRYTIPELGLF